MDLKMQTEAQLKELIRQAYVEGMDAGFSHSLNSDRLMNYDYQRAWEDSDAKKFGETKPNYQEFHS